MSTNKTRFEKLESAKKANTRHEHRTPEEIAQIRKIKEMNDILSGRVPMTPERQAKIDKLNSEKQWNFNQTFDQFIQRSFDHQYQMDESTRTKLAPMIAKFDNKTLLYTDYWQIMTSLY